MFRIYGMARLEQIAALVLAAGLAIPSYVFFWSLAGGGGYGRRGLKQSTPIESVTDQEIRPITVLREP